MTRLQDRLADLAEDAPPPRPAPELWDRGLRYRRRRWTGTAVVAAVAAVALLVLGTATWLRSSSDEPLPAGSPAAMPDHLYAASGWLPGTDRAGPLGPIAALVPTVRHTWTGDENGVVGVSATTGEYRFVDLPGLAVDDALDGSWSLSPDGRFIAYLYRDDGAHVAPGAATGVALYDTSTGD